MSRALVVVPALALIAQSSFGQLSIERATRSINGSWGLNGGAPLGSFNHSFDGPGYWDIQDGGGASARQTSDVRTNGVDFFSSVGTGGGAGHYSDAYSTLEVVFAIHSALAWTLHREWYYPGQDGPHLYRLGDNVDLLAHINRYVTPLDVTGYLDAGEYKYTVTRGSYNGAGDGNETDNFSVSVPAPSALVVGLMISAPSLSRRHRPG